MKTEKFFIGEIQIITDHTPVEIEAFFTLLQANFPGVNLNRPISPEDQGTGRLAKIKPIKLTFSQDGCQL